MSIIDRRDFLKKSGALLAAPLIIPAVVTDLFAADNAFTQSQWRFCDKCESLFFNGTPQKGICPGGGGHNAQGLDFDLPHGNQLTETPKAQANWRYCGKCFSMFFDGSPDKGRCAGGGGHSATGFKFRLPHDMAGDDKNQDKWRYCQKCHIMFYDGYPGKGKCAFGGGHSAYGYMFVLPHGNPPNIAIRQNVTTTGWAPIGGWTEVTADSEGGFSFKGHIHNSGAVNIRFTLAAALVTPSGQSFGFARNNRLVQGTEVLIGRTRDDDWSIGGNEIDIMRNWDQASRGQLHWRIVASSTVGDRLQGLVEDIAKEGFKRMRQAIGATPQGQVANFYLKMLSL